MTTRFSIYRFTRLAMVPLLAAAIGTAAAQGPPGHDRDDHHDNGNHGNQGDQGRGNNGQYGNNGQHGNNDRGNDFRFRDQDRGSFQSHYNKDINRWRRNSKGRPQFTRGQRIPANYRFQPVPRAYYSNVPPPPAGYQYGYYDGYVVAYNPTTRIIADVLDLVASASR